MFFPLCKSRPVHGPCPRSICCSTFQHRMPPTTSSPPPPSIKRCAMTKGRCASMPTHAGASISGYYFLDDYSLNNPYPVAQGGASVPGFNALVSRPRPAIQHRRYENAEHDGGQRTPLQFHARLQRPRQTARRTWRKPRVARFRHSFGNPNHRGPRPSKAKAWKTSSSTISPPAPIRTN